METGALWEQVSCCCSLANSTAGINTYIHIRQIEKSKETWTRKQFQTDTFYNSLSLNLASRLSSCCAHRKHKRGQHAPQTTSSELELFQPCFCSPVNVRFFFLSAAVSFLSLPPHPLLSESLLLVRRVLRRVGGREGREKEGRGWWL